MKSYAPAVRLGHRIGAILAGVTLLVGSQTPGLAALSWDYTAGFSRDASPSADTATEPAVSAHLQNGDDSRGVTSDLITAVPEPSTIIAGASLLLPFALSTLRFAKRRHG